MSINQTKYAKLFILCGATTVIQCITEMDQQKHAVITEDVSQLNQDVCVTLVLPNSLCKLRYVKMSNKWFRGAPDPQFSDSAGIRIQTGSRHFGSGRISGCICLLKLTAFDDVGSQK